MAARRGGGRRGARRSGNRPSYAWVGLQVNSTADIPAAGAVLVLVDQGIIERHGALTVERVRGTIYITNDDTDSANGGVTGAAKMLVFEINDAGVISGDANALDTDLEDISERILYQDIWHLGAAAATDFQDTFLRLDIDVKARVRMNEPKKILGILLDSTVNNRARFICNLRALVRVG